MKLELTIFRVLTFILLPIAIFLGGIDILMLFVALAGNPAQLLAVFLVATFVIYTFSCLRFLTRHIDPQQPAKPSLRDWIRVNSITSLVMAAMMLISTISFLNAGDASLREMITEMLEYQSGNGKVMSEDAFLDVFKTAIWFMLVVSSLIVAQILVGFRVIKRYRYLFGGNTGNTPPSF